MITRDFHDTSGITARRAIPENLEPLVRSMLRARHEWIGHVSIVTPDGIEIIPAKGE